MSQPAIGSVRIGSDPFGVPRWTGLHRDAGGEPFDPSVRREAAPAPRRPPEPTRREARPRSDDGADGARAGSAAPQPDDRAPPAEHARERPVAVGTATVAERGSETVVAGAATARTAAAGPAAIEAAGGPASGPAGAAAAGLPAGAGSPSATGTNVASGGVPATAPRATAAAPPPPPAAPVAQPSSDRSVRDATRPLPPRPPAASTLVAQAEAARDSILRSVALQTDRDGGHLRLALTPPELGRLDVDIVVEHGRDARVHIVADRAEVAHLLGQSLPELARMLAEQGLVITETSVQVRDDSARGGDSREGPERGNESDGAESLASHSLRSPRPLPTGTLDLWA